MTVPDKCPLCDSKLIKKIELLFCEKTTNYFGLNYYHFLFYYIRVEKTEVITTEKMRISFDNNIGAYCVSNLNLSQLINKAIKTREQFRNFVKLGLDVYV